MVVRNEDYRVNSTEWRKKFGTRMPLLKSLLLTLYHLLLSQKPVRSQSIDRLLLSYFVFRDSYLQFASPPSFHLIIHEPALAKARVIPADAGIQSRKVRKATRTPAVPGMPISRPQDGERFEIPHRSGSQHSLG